MPRFEPFAGLRYDANVAPLADVIAPPYDVVSPTDWVELADRSPYNAIHVELPALAEGSKGNRYEHAAALLARWESEGALRRDDVPALYIHRMRFRGEDGVERSTTGVIGALGLDQVGGSEVLPHERTMPKPKGDRLDLLRSTHTNLSPIWGLSLTSGLAEACIEATRHSPAPMAATDDEGVVHELWPVTDGAMIERITGLVSATPIVIADGHHRYETAIFYRTERHNANADGDGAYDLVMALVVELTEDELFVQAIHRLVGGLPDDLDILETLGKHFELSDAPDDPSQVAAELVAVGALGLVTKSANYFLVPRASVNEAAEADLDSSRLDVALASLPAHELTYQHGIRLAADAVATGRAQFAFLLRPATVAQIADTAHSGRRMPPKTTFFHPKPRTGMVYRPVPG